MGAGPSRFEQEELDREEFDYLQDEFGADGEYVQLLPRPCCLKTASLSVVHTSPTYHPTTSDGSRIFQMVGLERMFTLFATDFNVNSGESAEGSSIGTVACQ